MLDNLEREISKIEEEEAKKKIKNKTKIKILEFKREKEEKRREEREKEREKYYLLLVGLPPAKLNNTDISKTQKILTRVLAPLHEKKINLAVLTCNVDLLDSISLREVDAEMYQVLQKVGDMEKELGNFFSLNSESESKFESEIKDKK